MRVQEDMIHGLLELGPSVAPVLFTDDEYYLSYCGNGVDANNEHIATPSKSSLTCISDFKKNPFHLPYIRSLFSKLTSLPYSCQFYGYLNGDILLSPQILDDYLPAYRCDCSRERVERAVISLGKAQLDQLIEEDHGAELSCHFCGKRYAFSEQELRQIRDAAAR